jgi:chromosome segregation ATPase
MHDIAHFSYGTESPPQRIALSLAQAQREKEEIAEELQAILSQYEKLRSAIADAERSATEHQQKAAALSAELDARSDAMVQLEESVNQAKRIAQEREAETKIAHQHLAKKVKENAYLTDNLEQAQDQIHTLQLEAHTLRNQLENQKAETQRVRHLQEELMRQNQDAEMKMSKGESDYQALYEKWQKAEVNHKRLRHLEDKLQSIQIVLMSQEKAPDSESEARDDAPDLFSLSKDAGKIKRNLFES